MALPIVNGWLIDCRSAEIIVRSKNNLMISHCTQMCVDGRWFCCHCELDDFKAIARLKDDFVTNQDRVIEPDDDILKRSLAISNTPMRKKRLAGNDSAVFMTAIAASRNYGVITDHRSDVFSTAYDLCTKFGVPVYSVKEYFDRLH